MRITDGKVRRVVQSLLVGMTFAASACGGGGGSGDSGARSAQLSGNWLVPVDRVADGGPGKDGIPSVDNPQFGPAANAMLASSNLVIGVKVGGEVKAYPHDVMDWHEVVNDTLDTEPYTLNYCPLTGSAMLWKGDMNASTADFGVSGLLFNSNLILYDRETDSNWLQMQQRAVNGELIGAQAEVFQVVETRYDTWLEMYPNSVILTRLTGFSRDYDRYPYGSYRTDSELLFAVEPLDDRMARKTRVMGLNIDDTATAFRLDAFGAGIRVINETIGNTDVVIVGSSDKNFAAIFERTLSDGTVLEFSATSEPLPAVMQDNEGNTWDVFGQALTGTRAFEQLETTSSYIAYWFAWAAFNADSEIYDG